jgi:hypothetical protein
MDITGLLPFLWSHPNVKLFHSAEAADDCLLDSLSTVLEQVREKEPCVGR